METTQPEINLIGILFGFALIGGFIFFISYIEGKVKVKDLYYDKQRKLIDYAIIVFLSLSVIILIMKSKELFTENVPWGLFSLSIKFFIALLVAGEAEKLGRNKYIWGIFAFFEFHFALIALGVGSKLLRVKGQTKNDVLNLNKKTIDKENALNHAFNNGIIDYAKKEEKLTEIKNAYRIEIDNLLTNKLTEEYNSKLELALKNGIITQEEYESKKK